MPGSDFETNSRQRFWDAVIYRCQEITLANGYNTQPFVTNDPREAQNNEESFSLLVVEGGESVVEVLVGGCMVMELSLEILGYALSKDYNPTLQLNKLIQDVKNTLAGNLGSIGDYVGKSAAMSFGDLETDAGILTMDGVAAFSLPVNFTYRAGPTW